MTVYHWDKNRQLGHFSFHPDEEGLNDFRKYLYTTDKTPVRLLIDMIEEDFRKEKLPHVNSRDRKAIIERLISRHYRSNTDFVHYQIIGREDTGRKDDIVSVNVLTNPDLFRKWLDIIEETNVPLVGIWSLPLLGKQLLDYLDKGNESILLVTQQVPSNLRQTFIKNGQIINSRATVINTHTESIGKIIFEEVEQNTRFLTNQRFINFDETISVHVIGNSNNLDDIKQYCSDSGILNYHFYDNKNIKKKAGLATSESDLNDDLFAYLCANQWWSRGHYGSSKLFTGFYRYLSARLITAASFLLAVISVALSVSYISDIVVLRKEIKTNNQYAQVLESSYREQMLGIEAELKKTRGMESAVFMYEKILDSRDVSPQKSLALLSHILTSASINNTVITEISWQGSEEKLIEEDSRRRRKNDTQYSSVKDVNQLAVIKGYVQVSKTSIKYAVDKVNEIVDKLKQHRQVLDVRVVRLPLDVRSESNIQNEGGANLTKIEEDSKRGRFEFKVLMRGASA